MFLLFAVSIGVSSTVVGNPINNLTVITDAGVYKHDITVIPCEGAQWSSDADEVWIDEACRIEIEVCSEEDCWTDWFEAQPEGASFLFLQVGGFTWG